MPVSGDGFVTLADGSRRWGRFGAAGVLVRWGVSDDGDAEAEASPWYFLARRSEWCHQGGTWAIPGGALNQGESPLEGALREFAEEIGVVLGEDDFSVAHLYEDDHGGWSYWTVVIDVIERFAPPAPRNWETAETGWFEHHRVGELELLPPFRATLGRLGSLGSPGE